MAYDLPNIDPTQCTGFLYCIAQWASDVTNGFFWIAILLGFVVMLFFATQRLGTNRSFMFAGVVGLLASMFLATMQLVSWWAASIFILIGAISIVLMINSER